MSDYDVHAMRRTYRHATLRESDVGDDPIALFGAWFDDAKQRAPDESTEVNAMTLATATPEGDVSARIVLLKDFGDDGFVFYTNGGSQKGRQLAANPRAALVFYWAHVERQVRVVGDVATIARDRSEAYFRTRPRESQLGAVASEQSSVVADRATLEATFARLAEQYADAPISMPEDWGGYAVRAESLEFWQGQPGRMHDRLRFSRAGDGWTVARLCP